MDNLSLFYAVNISVGGQNTTVMLDAGSSEVWVDPDCSKTALHSITTSGDGSTLNLLHSPDYCKSIGRYDPGKSPSSKDVQQGGKIHYADNSAATINYYADNIGIGDLQLVGQQFGVANVSKHTALGVMGLGPSDVYGYNQSSHNYNLVLDSMASQGLLESRAHSVLISEIINLRPGPSYLVGWIRKSSKAPFRHFLLDFPVLFGYFVTVQSLSMAKADDGSPIKYDQVSFPAVLDSGTSFMLMPSGVSSRVCNELGGSSLLQSEIGICELPCEVRDASGGLDLHFENKTIRVNFEDLLIDFYYQGEIIYMLAVADTLVETDPPTYILGAPFLRAAYAVFDWDNQQFQLAQAADCGSQMVAIGNGAGAVPTGPGCDESAAVPSSRSNTGPVMAVAPASILPLI